MLGKQFSLKQYHVTDNPLNDLDDDIENMIKYLAYFGSDSGEIVRLIKTYDVWVTIKGYQDLKTALLLEKAMR
jgi:hypothetical protein